MNSPVNDSANPARALLKQLEQQFDVFRKGVPLSIGVDKAIIQRLPEVNRKHLRIALAIHTHSTRYLKSMEKAQTRFDLDGNPCGEVLEAHRHLAAETLKARHKKAAEHRKERERAAEEERKQHRHAEKLRLLAEKFSAKR